MNAVVNVNKSLSGPPRLIPSASAAAGIIPLLVASSAPGGPPLLVPKSGIPKQQAIAAAISVQAIPAASKFANVCCVGTTYRVLCQRKYLGAENGYIKWEDVDPSVQSIILSKIQNQVKPKPKDLICKHHVKELSYTHVETADERGPCDGYGIAHKSTVQTTRLGVLSYFNKIAGKNHDVLPGKFVCSTCIKVLRGASPNPNTFLTSNKKAVPVPIQKGVPGPIPTQQNDPKLNSRQENNASHCNPEPNNSIKLSHINHTVEVLESQPHSLPVQVKIEVEEEKELILEPLDIVIGESQIIRRNTEEKISEIELDPLDLSSEREQFFQNDCEQNHTLADMNRSKPGKRKMETTNLISIAERNCIGKTQLKIIKTNHLLLESNTKETTNSEQPGKTNVNLKNSRRNPPPKELFSDSDPEETSSARFQKLNCILTTAGVAPFLEAHAGLPIDHEIIKSTAIQKINQLVQKCVTLFRKDSVDINMEAIYNFTKSNNEQASTSKNLHFLSDSNPNSDSRN